MRFYLDEAEPSASMVGEREVWAWPFPEAATVARQLKITGDSAVRMGTAPAIWNTVRGAVDSPTACVERLAAAHLLLTRHELRCLD